MIIKNEIPILEFDNDKAAVIMPNHEKLGIKLPEKAVFAFLESYVDGYAKEHNAKVISHFVNITKEYPIYVVEHQGEDICLVQAPMGAPAAVQILDWLFGYGVKKVISCGSCGVLVDIPENEFLVPDKALRDEGTSYHYVAPSRYMEVNELALAGIEKALKKHQLPYRRVLTWTTDAFYRETKELVSYRREEGCQVVEMECAALAACAKMRGAIWGQILFTADSLANVEEHDMRNMGMDAYEYALELCMDAVLEL